MKRVSICLTCLLAPILGPSAAAPASISATLSGATANAAANDSQISATDLVNAGQTTLAGVTATNPTYQNGTVFPLSGLNDGSASANNKLTYYQAADTPATITFNLNQSPGAGGSATGYDITGIKSFAGWTDSNIGAQSFQLFVATLLNPSFTSLGTFTNTSGFTSGTTGQSLSSLTTLTDTTGTIASGVTAVQFKYASPSSLGIGQGTSAGGTVIREIDVFGTPTAAPEPGSLGLLGAGALLLLRRRPRR